VTGLITTGKCFFSAVGGELTTSAAHGEEAAISLEQNPGAASSATVTTVNLYDGASFLDPAGVAAGPVIQRHGNNNDGVIDWGPDRKATIAAI